jgi:orotate phosphoribosyltransferase
MVKHTPRSSGVQTPDAFLELVAGRRGHFLLESGHHGELWLDLDGLFARPGRVAPLIARLAEALRPHQPAGICGPLVGGAFLAQSVAAVLDLEFSYTERVPSPASTGLYQARYRLPAAFSSRAHGRRVAIVDDVMSAGSAARGTYAELQAHGAHPVVVGALLVLGSAGEDFFLQHGLAVEAVTRLPFSLWPPTECPLCAAGVPLEYPGKLGFPLAPRSG